MKRLADVLFEYLAQKEIKDVFMVSGGGIMHLVDALGLNKNINYYCNNHEQASAICAESYSRLTGKLGVCLVTTGPGSTNALSAIAGAFVDSIPLLVISGQVRTAIISDYSKLRQLGPQEINIDDMAKPVTKYFKTLKDPNLILFELEKAMKIAFEGRPGPVWLNLPLDLQSALIDESNLERFHESDNDNGKDETYNLKQSVKEMISLLTRSKRPVIVGGYGIRLSNSIEGFKEFVKKYKIPFVLTIGSMDIVSEDEPFFIGRFGPFGQRRANFAFQNADLVIGIGTSFSLASIGFDLRGFAPSAKKVQINIDCHELNKQIINIDLPICADLKRFFETFKKEAIGINLKIQDNWMPTCELWKEKYPIVDPNYTKNNDYINSYYFTHLLSTLTKGTNVFVTGNSLDIVSAYQTFIISGSQRFFTNINFGAMGWDIPAAVGACIGNNQKEVILITGDGSFQFNIQELMAIRYYKLPIKIFVFNNRGYQSIRSSQDNYFNSRYVGSDFNSGIGNPDFEKIAQAYELKYFYLGNDFELEDKLKNIISESGSFICELNLNEKQERSPRVSSFKHEDGRLETRPLEDMYPFLPREEIKKNMSFFD